MQRLKGEDIEDIEDIEDRMESESEGGERYLLRLNDGLLFLPLEADESKSRKDERDGMMDRLLRPGAEEDMMRVVACEDLVSLLRRWR